MPFKKGHKKTGGRTKGTPNHNGLVEAINIITSIWEKEKNKQKFRKACQDDFNTDPIKFFMKLGLPLTPKDINLDVSGELETIATIINKPLKSLPKKKK